MTLDYRNSKHESSQGSAEWPKAIGWVAGAIFILFLLFILFMPSTGRARETAQRVKCASNLRQIGQAAFLYANDHSGQLPPDLATILETQDIASYVFTCPSSRIEEAKGATTQQVVASFRAGKHNSYAWLGRGLTANQPTDVVLAFDLEKHVPRDAEKTTGINVLHGDFSVSFESEATAKAIYAQFVAGVRPIRLSTATAASTQPSASP